MNAKWFAIPALAAALVLGGAQTGSIKAADNAATAQDFSSKGKGHGHAKGHARGHGNGHWRGAYAYHGANSPYFCPPGQAKKPGLGSRFRC